MIDTTYSTTPPIDGVVGVRGTAVLERTSRFTGKPVPGATTASVAGTAAADAVRLRVPMTGLPIGSGAFHQLNSDTPGDLPPRDPLS